jgi:hypothetical protein
MSSTSTHPATSTQPSTDSEELLQFDPWHDPHFDRWGVEPRSPYVERFWVPVLGPSAFVLARNITAVFASHHGSYNIDTETQAALIGTSPGQLRRIVERLVQFGLAKRIVTDHIAIRTSWPAIGNGALRQLPEPLRQAHGDWMLLTDTLDPEGASARRWWRYTITAHGTGVSPVELDVHLRRMNCDEQLRVEFVDWCRTTPRFGRVAKR